MSAVLCAVVGATSSFTAGCDDPCASSETPTAELGVIAGAADFEPVEDGATVTLGSAPQGGQGIFMAVRAEGLESHPFLGLFAKRLSIGVRVIDRTSGDEDVLGDFSTGSNIRCVDGAFGIASDVVFGLESERFGFGPDFENEPNANLVAIDGHTVTLEAELFDENGSTVSVSRDVVLDTAPDVIENP